MPIPWLPVDVRTLFAPGCCGSARVCYAQQNTWQCFKQEGTYLLDIFHNVTVALAMVVFAHAHVSQQP